MTPTQRAERQRMMRLRAAAQNRARTRLVALHKADWDRLYAEELARVIG